jgi:hypothetical protein
VTDPAKSSGRSEVSGSAFSGPTGAQVGSSNTQINHYSMPSTSPGGARRGARRALIATAAVLVSGVIVFTAIWFATSPDKPEYVKIPTADRVEINPADDDGLCVDVEGNKDVPESTVQLFTCNRGPEEVPGQKWNSGDDGTIRSFSQCLSAKNEETAIGTPVVLSKCIVNDSQRWEWLDLQGEAGPGKLHNIKSDRCLGYLPQDGKSDRDAPLALYGCDSEFAREWTFR